MAWSARLLNRYGVEALRDLLPETERKKDRKKKPVPRITVEPEEPKFEYCFYADFCEDPQKNQGEGNNCSNRDRGKCYEVAKRRYGSLLPDEGSQ